MRVHDSWDIVVVGGANWDYLVRGPRLPTAGETVPGDLFHEGPGGKGANQAVGAARLGARVAFVARVGSDVRGEVILARLADERVNLKYAVRDPVLETGVALVMVDMRGEKQILTAKGANGWLSVADVKDAVPAIERAQVLLTQLEVPLDAVKQAMQSARRSNTKVILDAGPPVALDDELLAMVDVIRANADEAEVITGIAVRDPDSARCAARQLLNRGVKSAVLQVGAQGNLVLSPEVDRLLPRIQVPAVDGTGAGDAFAAALAVMLADQKSLLEAATFANAAAALKTTVVGAQPGLPKRNTVLALLSSPTV